MSDSRRTYRAIQTKLVQLRGYPTGRVQQRTAVLAAFIAGIVRSKSSQGRKVAEQSGLRSKVESRIKQLERWYRNQNVSYELDYLPYMSHLLQELSDVPWVLAIDGSEIGRGCMALMINLVYEKRSIPLAWVVFQRPKGHASAAEHIELIEQVLKILPEEQEIVFLGDGEFDSIELQERIRCIEGWDYVCRTAKNIIVHSEGERFPLEEVVFLPDMTVSLPHVLVTEEMFGPVHLALVWDQECDEPLYLVTSFELAEEAYYWYQRRMRIETFFSDQKSRGFNLHKCHVSDPLRLSRILIAASLAYLWMIYLGVHAHLKNMVSIIHRTDRCDLSLFQLGLALLQHFLNESMTIHIDFRLHKDFLLA